jgi:Tol biopolymer transport system component
MPAPVPACTPMPSSTDPLADWRSGFTARPVSARSAVHTIHAYFNTCPESPDGRYVVYYTSTTSDGHLGGLRILERATGREKVLARNVQTEDAHRAACQQWIGGGRFVVFHDYRDGRWIVAAVDVESGEEKVLALDRQVGFGTSESVEVPLYGCHWNPGEHRDFELANVETGEIRTIATPDQVRAEYPEWMGKEFGARPTSIFFPILSPDGQRVMFKMSAGSGGDNFRDAKASHREGKIVYDIANKRFIRCFERWGHPSWHPDSRRILDKGNILFDPETGKSQVLIIDGPSDHASFSPIGNLFVTDGKVLSKDAPRQTAEWGIFVADPARNEYAIVHRFQNDRGAESWRKNHPHPAFSRDGRRIYFNVNEGPLTQLYVAEAAK